ncbi:uridine kinase [Nanchangia anserum]|uniref:Uridine kinase n=1 Tax=Nanchangia anserum TaxID=2692125 RepID=A0A8I0GC43_9ACTO|nr:uridine kinase [Nanchangia anserum]QOX82660.1 uridine kinase [Nanchangia anserum]
MRPTIIGIAGGTCSGKSTLTRALSERFVDQTAVMLHDNYYRSRPDLPLAERAALNYDEPAAFETSLLISHLRALLAGECVEMPTYDYVHHDRAEPTITIRPRPVIIVEGILVLTEQELCDVCDIKIFVDTDADVRLLRRIRRDAVERGRSLESVERQYLQTVKPMHELYVEPSKRRADIIVPEGGSNLVALDMLTHRIQRIIEDHAAPGAS